MSNSPSPSPHTNLPNNPSSSRTPTHDQPASARPIAEDPSHSSTQTRPPIPHSRYIEDPLSSASSASPRTRRRPASSDAPDERMSKRIRRPSPQPTPRSRASSSESQGGMADTEEAEPSHHSQRTPPPMNPQKKKRTRTLTTPHQSAVLHALLAQSRFPTTAMREEVGRSIGLSARKVQIWFQNQRQKARRPRTQGELPLTRPPQYGPYPSTGDSVPLGPAPGSASQSHSPQYGQYSRGAYTQTPADTTTHLSVIRIMVHRWNRVRNCLAPVCLVEQDPRGINHRLLSGLQAKVVSIRLPHRGEGHTLIGRCAVPVLRAAVQAIHTRIHYHLLPSALLEGRERNDLTCYAVRLLQVLRFLHSFLYNLRRHQLCRSGIHLAWLHLSLLLQRQK
ncbi:homeobox-domain-containing protein [Hymenopellis radicata]|nr:homeobox-domain-containing protein [Hymenopellis radicata]